MKPVGMHCPRCSEPVLDEREREGITVDVCPACRGVWLDRGELERFLARARDAWEPRLPDDDRAYAPPRRYDDDHYDHDGRRYGRHPKRKRFLDVLGDLFD